MVKIDASHSIQIAKISHSLWLLPLLLESRIYDDERVIGKKRKTIYFV